MIQIPRNWDTKLHSALGMLKPQGPAAKPFPLTGLKLCPFHPVHLSWITVRAGVKVQSDVAGQSKRPSWLTQGCLLYRNLLLIPGPSLTRAYCAFIWGTTGETITRFIKTLFCCWVGQMLPNNLVVSECPIPLLGKDMLLRLGTTLVWENFPAP